MERNFIEMALDRRMRPRLHEELIEEYGRWRGDPLQPPRVLRPKALDPRHVNEAYRPAWESLLLEPPSEATRFMAVRFTVTTALALIRDKCSLAALAFACRSATLV